MSAIRKLRINNFSWGGFYPVLFMRFILTAILGIGLLEATRADTHYVAQGNQTPSPNYLSWTSAASNIQDAVNVAASGDTVLVSNGVYQTGGTNFSALYQSTNRIVISGQIVRSVNGPAVTIIKGAWHSPTVACGQAAVRCVWFSSGSLIGFTLTSGATWGSGEGPNDTDRSGGGIWSGATTPIVSNCVIVGNSAYAYAGGVYFCSVYNCLIASNSSSYGGGAASANLYNCTIISNSTAQGGGAYGCNLYNCLIAYNSASHGGGVNGNNLYNCTVVSNYTTTTGGGVRNCPIVCNSIVYFNTSPDGNNWKLSAGTFGFTNSCTFPTPSGAGITWTTGTTNDPQLVNKDTGNFRLSNTSPCINTGTNFPWMSDPADGRSKDLDGRPRLRDGGVDMGCYEHISKGTVFSSR